MSENCPECKTSLIPLHECHVSVSTGIFITGSDSYSEVPDTHDNYKLYGYWCPNCEKLYEKHHKEWLELWKYQSLKGKVKT